jgi:hypothetical protein
MVTDQVLTAGSEVVGKTAATFINPNSNDLPHEMAHQFMGDTQGWRNWADEITVSAPRGRVDLEALKATKARRKGAER